jgi:Tol biopolymer transport system component
MRRLIAPVLAALAMLAIEAPTVEALGAGGEKAAFGLSFGNSAVGLMPTAISGDGRLLFFESPSMNLSPDNIYGNRVVYMRDLDSGETTLPTIEPTLQQGREFSSVQPSVSVDGRFLAVIGVSLQPTRTIFSSIYVHDLQANTSKIASRASGPNGTIATEAINYSLSADGRFVAFQTPSPLDPADTDSLSDVYVRDLQNDTTVLVSRVSGASGAKSDQPSQNPSISGDGRFVAFESSANLADDPVPEPACKCVYRRDLQTATNTLVSRADADNDPVTITGNYTNPTISTDGNLVAFVTDRCFALDDADAAVDIYLRDVAAHTTRLVDRADGAAGAKANGTPAAPVTFSSNGRFVGFASRGTNLDPDDLDTNPDAYLRDLQTDTTTLVDRASGAAGAKANNSAAPYFSADGRFLAFNALATTFDRADTDSYPDAYVRDLQTLETSLESRATPGYVRPVRPKGATPLRLSLVPAAQPCTVPNTTHGAPLSFGSCAPVVSASPNLTVSDGEVRARSVGFVKLKVFPGHPETTADEADVGITFALSNVMHAPGLSDYTGELQARATVRLTDQFNGPSQNQDQTTEDFDFKFTIPCVATASTTDGSQCNLTAWADVVFPGFVPEGKRADYGFGQIRIYDGGPDEDADTTGDNSLFAVQGVFVP